MKFIDPRVHAMLDHVVVVAFLCAPALFGFTGRAATLSYAIAAIHFTVSILTAYPFGLIKLIPFGVHGVLETLCTDYKATSPWRAAVRVS